MDKQDIPYKSVQKYRTGFHYLYSRKESPSSWYSKEELYQENKSM